MTARRLLLVPAVLAGAIVLVLSGAVGAAESAAAPDRIAFPADAAVLDAKRDLGAKGDGAADCNSVLRTHPRESGKTSADWFMRNIRNLTIDAGDNPNTDGIRWYATNTGILRNVRVVGRGKIGINAGFLGQSGPNLIQDCVVEGFETGILSQWIWGETISRVTIRNCCKVGLVVDANAVGVEDLVVENTPLAVRCEFPNDWTWWGGVIALVGGRFTGGSPDGAACPPTL